jgi:hypothetical protein
MTKGKQLDIELEEHLKEYLDLVDGEVSEFTNPDTNASERTAFRVDALIKKCKFAITSVNGGHGDLIIKNIAGRDMVRPQTSNEPWTATKFVHDLKLDKFLRSN